MRSASGNAQAVSTSRRIALVTCAELPHLDHDTHRLLPRLLVRGLRPEPAVWDDPHVDWETFDLAIVRSCWDYVPRRRAFLEWTTRVPALANPAGVLAWNTDKRYLRTLARRGISTIPTEWVHPHDSWDPSSSGECVIKPAVSIASLDTGRYRLIDFLQRSLAIDHVRRLQAQGRITLIQSYMPGVEHEGETSLVYLGGRFSHAVRKAPSLAGPDTGVDRRFLSGGGLDPRPRRPTPAQLALAERVLAAVPGGCRQLLYARVDLAPDESGNPVLMELELTEPQLFLGTDDGAADRLAEAIAAKVGSLAMSNGRRSVRWAG